MKALRIAFFTCVLSVFFCITAYADDSVTLAIPYLSSVTVTEAYTATVTTNGEAFMPGDLFYIDVGNTWSAFSVINYNGVNVGGANVDYSADFVVESVSAGAGVTVTRSGNRFYLKNEYVNFGTSGIPITVIYTVSAKWNRGVIPSTNNPIENCYLSTTCSVKMSAANKYGVGPNELDDRNTLHSINSKVDDILEQLDELGKSPPNDFLGPDALIYFDPRYFDNWSDSVSEHSSGYFNVQTGSPFAFWNRPSSPAIFFDVGQYYVVVSSNGGQVKDLKFQTDESYYSLKFVHNYANKGSLLDVFLLDVHQPFTTFEIAFNPRPGDTLSGLFYGGIVPRSSSDALSDALNPDQNNKNNELSNEGNKLSQQENQLWQNVNSYKSQLDFSLSGWNEATNGLGYVSSIFMKIWNNSPRQIITLSLMLGIGMLAIGRGVKAAVRQKDGDS